LKYFKNISFYIVLFVMLLAFLVIVQSRPVEKEQSIPAYKRYSHGKVQEIILEDNKATVKYKEEGQRTSLFIYPMLKCS